MKEPIHRGKELLPLSLGQAASAGDAGAVESVLRHYDGYMRKLRHTFCTKKANAGMNPKALQYIMGHANIVVTLNYYAHATFHSAQAEMDRLEPKVETTMETRAAA